VKNLRKDNPLVSVILPNYNGRNLLKPCLEAIFRTNYSNYEVLLVDDKSIDGGPEYARQLFGSKKNFRIIYSQTRIGAAGARTLGVKESKGEIIIFLDNDAIVKPEWITELVKVLESDSKIGMAQCKMLTLDNQICCAGEYLIPYLGWVIIVGMDEEDAPAYRKVMDITASSGATAVKRSVIKESGLYDGKFFFNQFEDLDFSLRVWLAGYRVVLAPRAEVYHDARVKGTDPKRNKIIQYASQRNCIRMVLKDYGTRNLIRYLPTVILGMTFRALFAIIKRREVAPLAGLIKAVFWNVCNIRDTLKERRIVQNKVRKVSDRLIMERIGIKISPWRIYKDYLLKGKGF